MLDGLGGDIHHQRFALLIDVGISSSAEAIILRPGTSCCGTRVPRLVAMSAQHLAQLGVVVSFARSTGFNRIRDARRGRA